MMLLELQNVTHSFGGLKALGNCTLSVAPGELMGVIGPNGAGKTTLFNLITGVYRPGEGCILLDGKPVTGLSPARICRLGVARTFQNIRLFRTMTVLDNLRIACRPEPGTYGLVRTLLGFRALRRGEKEITRRAHEILEVFGLERVAFQEAGGLPYGLQRVLEIARALATRPRLLLLDEPAAGMNPTEIDALIRLVRRIRGEFGLTVILIEHQMRLVMSLCERIRVLDFGLTIADGTAQQVRTDPRVLRAYLGGGEES